jgi:hypothetical protein
VDPTYRINETQVCAQHVEDGVVLIHLGSTHYYSLNATGAYLWECLTQAPLNLPEAAAKVAEYFGADPEVVRPDVQAVLTELASEELVQLEWGKRA